MFSSSNKEKPKKIAFPGQGKHLFAGARACVSVAIAAFAQFSKINNAEFSNIFLSSTKYIPSVQKKKADHLLNNIVKTGVKVNTKIAKGNKLSFFSKLISKKGTDEVWANEVLTEEEKMKLGLNHINLINPLPEIIAYNKDSDEISIHPNDAPYVDIPANTYGNKDDTFKKIFEERLNAHPDKGLVVTEGHHAILLFQREIDNKLYFISINSGDQHRSRSYLDRKLRQAGQMEIHSSFDSLYESLSQEWKNENGQDMPNQVDISLFTSTNEMLLTTQPKRVNEGNLKLFHLIQEIVFMSAVRNLTNLFSLPTGIKKMQNELLTNNEEVDEILVKLQATCGDRLGKGTRHKILDTFYRTISQVNIESIEEVVTAVTALDEIKKSIIEYAAEYQDSREYSKSSPNRSR